MKQTPILIFMLMIATFAQAQELFAPLQQFADICVRQKTLMNTAQPDYEQQYSGLTNCLLDLVALPIEQTTSFHPSHIYQDKDFEGHILFSPQYLSNYLLGNVPDHYRHSIPHDIIMPDKVRAIKDLESHKKATDYTIYFYNSLIRAESEMFFIINISKGEQQILLLTEDDTDLQIRIISDSGTYDADTQSDTGLFTRIWQEEEDGKVIVKVSNKTAKDVTFVIASF